MNERDKIPFAPNVESKSLDSSASAPRSAKSSEVNPRAASQISTTQTALPAIPDYELLRRIGGGSYGDVWLARSATGTLRALKIVWRHTFEDERPFQREFEGIQSFERLSRDHPSQLALFHVGRGEGYFYYVMELADDNVGQASCLPVQQASSLADPNAKLEASPPAGKMPALHYTPHTLRADLQHGRLPAARVLELGLVLTEALGHLHTNGLVHRDVKPSNIIFVGGKPKLADIGLVTDAGDTHSIVGTEGYLAPEGPGTPQADLFALGKVLYEALTGLDRRQLPQLPSDLRIWPDAAQVFELNEIILKACAADPRQRYASAEEMRADLESLREGKSVRRVHQVECRWRAVRRGAGWMVVTAVALTLIILASRVRQPRVNQAVEGRSTNQVANGFYKLGRHSFEKNTEKDILQAAVYFAQATNADPAFAQAYASLALTYAWSMDGWRQLPQGKAVALKALKLDDTLGDPHIVLGWYKVMREWNWKEAEQDFKRAIQLNPSGAIGYHFYAEFLRMTGRTNESVQTMRQALQLESGSVSVSINRRFADHLVAARRYEEAIIQADQAIALEPNIPTPVHAFRIRALLALGRYDDAIDTERKYRLLNVDSAGQVEAEIRKLKEALAAEVPRGYWRMQLKEAGESPFWRARVYAQLGETEAAITCLQTAMKERDVWLTFYVMTDWTLDPLRSDPRFHAILKEMHLE